MKALISPNEQRAGGARVVELREEPFDVAAPLFWVDAPGGVAQEWAYLDGQFYPQYTAEQLAEQAAREAARTQMLADAQDARDDVLVQAIAGMSPAQLVDHIDTAFPDMTAAQRQVLKVLAKMARISAKSLA